MKGNFFSTTAPRISNILEFSGVILVLLIALGMQVFLHELPCPLCLLQRLGFFGIALGLLMNLRYGFRPSHYAVVIISALFTACVALRQVALHVVPGTGSYNLPILGLHLYTWSFIVSIVVILATTFMLSIDRQYQPQPTSPRIIKLTHFLFGFLALLIALNLIGVIFECGLKECPANPTEYLL